MTTINLQGNLINRTIDLREMAAIRSVSSRDAVSSVWERIVDWFCGSNKHAAQMALYDLFHVDCSAVEKLASFTKLRNLAGDAFKNQFSLETTEEGKIALKVAEQHLLKIEEGGLAMLMRHASAADVLQQVSMLLAEDVDIKDKMQSLNIVKQWAQGASICLDSIESKLLISNIAVKMSLTAKTFFAPLLAMQSIAQPANNAPIVSGDTDGSTARAILLGIQSGKLSITEKGQEILLQLLEEEARAASRWGKLGGKFQSDPVLQANLANISAELTYSKGLRPLIFIGDVAHDRFSCNKDVDREIREKLHEQGVVYIFGNHDTHQVVGKLKKGQSGESALDTATPEQWAFHEEKVFVNAYFDAHSQTLYIHNGLRAVNNHTIDTAFGEVNLAMQGKVDELVNKINAQLQTRSSSKTTKFRPSANEIQKVAQSFNIRIAHGHNGIFNPLDRANVVSLNARSDTGFATSAVILGDFKPSTYPPGVRVVIAETDHAKWKTGGG